MDITQLILGDHHEQRRLFGMLQEIGREDAEALGAVWNRLAALLDLHAAAEERLFYPALLKLGKGSGGDETPDAETKDAIHDHNEIRDAVAAVAEHAVGSDGWFRAVSGVDKANGDHMAEEEREGLKDFRMHASLQARHDLAVAFAAFEAAHVTGVEAKDQDPQAYLERAFKGSLTKLANLSQHFAVLEHRDITGRAACDNTDACPNHAHTPPTHDHVGQPPDLSFRAASGLLPAPRLPALRADSETSLVAETVDDAQALSADEASLGSRPRGAGRVAGRSRTMTPTMSRSAARSRSHPRCAWSAPSLTPRRSAPPAQCVVIGGYAAVLAGIEIVTIDITPATDPANLQRLTDALGGLHAAIRVPNQPPLPLPPDPRLLARGDSWNLATDAGDLDITTRPDGTDGYEDLRRGAYRQPLADGLHIAIVAAGHHRRKTAAGRAKDLRPSAAACRPQAPAGHDQPQTAPPDIASSTPDLCRGRRRRVGSISRFAAPRRRRRAR